MGKTKEMLINEDWERVNLMEEIYLKEQEIQQEREFYGKDTKVVTIKGQSRLRNCIRNNKIKRGRIFKAIQ